MTKLERTQVEYAIAELEALREFEVVLPAHVPKLERALLHLRRLTKRKEVAA